MSKKIFLIMLIIAIYSATSFANKPVAVSYYELYHYDADDHCVPDSMLVFLLFNNGDLYFGKVDYDYVDTDTGSYWDSRFSVTRPFYRIYHIPVYDEIVRVDDYDILYPKFCSMFQIHAAIYDETLDEYASDTLKMYKALYLWIWDNGGRRYRTLRLIFSSYTNTIINMTLLSTFNIDIEGIWEAPAPSSDSSNDDIKVYPNPTNGKAMMDTNHKMEQLNLYDINGRIIKSVKSNKIDFERLPSGMYFIGGNENGRNIYKKIDVVK